MCDSCVTTAARYDYPTTRTGSSGAGGTPGYKTLGYYNANIPGSVGAVAPQIVTLKDTRLTIPGWGGVAYNDAHGVLPGANAGYYSLSSAYPNFANACCQYTDAMCGGGSGPHYTGGRCDGPAGCSLNKTPEQCTNSNEIGCKWWGGN